MDNKNPSNADAIAATSQFPSIFQWDTMKEIGPDNLRRQGKVVAGSIWHVKLSSGQWINVWRSLDGQHYFCHGLTFGGKNAPGGSISPYTGEPVEVIVRHYYQLIADIRVEAGDILVWNGIAPETTPHSAIITAAVIESGKGWLHGSTKLQTKNGLSPEATVTLQELIEI